MAEIKLQVKGYRCERCGHQWIPKKEQYPITCPKCKSAYWDKPRQNKEKNNEQTKRKNSIKIIQAR